MNTLFSTIHFCQSILMYSRESSGIVHALSITINLPWYHHCQYWEEIVGNWPEATLFTGMSMVIGIDHDTVCAGVVGTAIRNSTSCAGRRAAACGRVGRHNECCSRLQYQPWQRRPYKWSISILPRSQFTKSTGNLRFRRLVPLFRPHRRLRNDAWRRDRLWRHNLYVTSQSTGHEPQAQQQTLVFTPKVA